MKIQRVVCAYVKGASVVLALVLSALSVHAAEPLKVDIMPELPGLKPQSGFEPMYIPLQNEREKSMPPSKRFGDITVTINGTKDILGDRMVLQPTRLVPRIRDIPPEAKGFVNSKLLSTWVGIEGGFSIQFDGLKPRTAYKVTFYAYDYPHRGSERAGKDVIQDVLRPTPPLVLEWNTALLSDKLNANTPPDHKSGTLISLSSGSGHLIYIIESGLAENGIALLNGFIIEEAR